jgi:hypothetical protein
MTPEEERAKKIEDRIQRLSDMVSKAKEAFNKGLGKIDNAGQKFDTFMNPPVNYLPAVPPAKPANDVAEKPTEAPKKKTKKIYRF